MFLTILVYRLILAARLCPGRTSAYRYITVLKIQTGICKDGRRVKMESFWLTISIWSLGHKPTIKRTIKSIWPLLFLRNFDREIFSKLLSNHLWQILFWLKSHASSILFWKPLDGCACKIGLTLFCKGYC